MSTLSPDSRPRRRLGIWIRREFGSLQVGHLDVALELSDVAQVLFEKADGKHTIGELADLVAEQYDISRADALDDTVEFVASMIESRVMVLEPDDAPSTP